MLAYLREPEKDICLRRGGCFNDEVLYGYFETLQPDELDDEEFNMIIRPVNRKAWGWFFSKSIDFDFVQDDVKTFEATLNYTKTLTTTSEENARKLFEEDVASDLQYYSAYKKHITIKENIK